jgi:hypothetical protein
MTLRKDSARVDGTYAGHRYSDQPTQAGACNCVFDTALDCVAHDESPGHLVRLLTVDERRMLQMAQCVRGSRQATAGLSTHLVASRGHR